MLSAADRPSHAPHPHRITRTLPQTSGTKQKAVTPSRPMIDAKGKDPRAEPVAVNGFR